jgi:ABC-type branched-subunit amino acid transport system substrate-binding protein
LTENFIDERAGVQAFYTRYEEQYEPLPAEIRPLMAYTYDAVQVLLDAIENAAIIHEDGGISMMRPVLAEAVRDTQGFSGLTGPIAFDENGDRSSP